MQVKSAASLQDLQEYIATFRAMEQFQEMFFVVHTAPAQLQEHAKREGGKTLGARGCRISRR